MLMNLIENLSSGKSDIFVAILKFRNHKFIFEFDLIWQFLADYNFKMKNNLIILITCKDKLYNSDNQVKRELELWISSILMTITKFLNYKF